MIALIGRHIIVSGVLVRNLSLDREKVTDGFDYGLCNIANMCSEMLNISVEKIP
jgi:hypothetical protein